VVGGNGAGHSIREGETSGRDVGADAARDVDTAGDDICCGVVRDVLGLVGIVGGVAADSVSPFGTATVGPVALPAIVVVAVPAMVLGVGEVLVGRVLVVWWGVGWVVVEVVVGVAVGVELGVPAVADPAAVRCPI
jgi:hypothetical protein